MPPTARAWGRAAQRLYCTARQPNLAKPDMRVIIDKGSLEKICNVIERMKHLDKFLNVEVRAPRARRACVPCASRARACVRACVTLLCNVLCVYCVFGCACGAVRAMRAMRAMRACRVPRLPAGIRAGMVRRVCVAFIVGWGTWWWWWWWWYETTTTTQPK